MPYPNYHSCRMNDPSKYEKIRTEKNAMKVNGKSIDVLYGVKNGKSEIQAYRYPSASFSEDEAKKHCSDKGGSFHPAKKTSSAMHYLSKSDWAIKEDELRDILTQINDNAEVFFDVGDVSRNEPKVEGKTAKIELIGPLFKYSNILTVIGVGTSLEDYTYQLDKAYSLYKQGKIKGAQVHIDSPGGQASGIDAAASKTHEIAKEMPIHGVTSGMCCSGAYWLGSSMTSLTATSDTDIFGSVGVILRIDKPYDDEYTIVSSNAPNKVPDPETDEGKKVLQQHVDILENIFMEKVATYRGTSIENVKENYGKGGILYRKDALAAGMIDEITSNGGNMEITAQFLKDNHTEVVNELVKEATSEKDQEISTLQKKIDDLNEEIKGLEGSDDYTGLSEEAQAKLAEANARVEALEKENLETKLNYCSDEQKQKLMGLYGKLPNDEILAIGEMFKTMQDTINELGKAQGSTASPSAEQKAETEKEKKIIEREKELVANGIPAADAYKQAYREMNA